MQNFVLGIINARKLLLCLFFLTPELIALETCVASDGDNTGKSEAIWMNGTVLAKEGVLLFRTEKTVQGNTQGKTVVLGATTQTAKTLLPIYAQAIKAHLQLRLYGVLEPTSKSLAGRAQPLPSIQFITWKVHVPSDPDELPADQKATIHPGDTVPGWEVKLQQE